MSMMFTMLLPPSVHVNTEQFFTTAVRPNVLNFILLVPPMSCTMTTRKGELPEMLGQTIQTAVYLGNLTPPRKCLVLLPHSYSFPTIPTLIVEYPASRDYMTYNPVSLIIGVSYDRIVRSKLPYQSNNDYYDQVEVYMLIVSS
jgi:hypothetical protein